MTILKTGKLPNALLADLLAGINAESDHRLLVGPGVGEDAAHIDFGPTTLVAKSDPITFATDQIGYYAINVNANDVAVSGATPKWFLATLLMPPDSTATQVRDIFLQLRNAANDLNVTLAGGHTEITASVTQPVICGFMLGEAPAGETVSTANTQPGDTIILTKGIAIEGTAILAREAPDELASAGVDHETIQRAANLLNDPGISVVNDAQLAVASGGVHAMHDITEGGIATAASEMAIAASVDLQLDANSVQVLAETATICNALNLDPWGLISSGAMLAAVDPEHANRTVEALQSSGISATAIGKACEPSDPANPTVWTNNQSGDRAQIARFERDELARYFDNTTV